MNSSKRKLLWVTTGHLEKSLDSATWLDTSRELDQFGWEVTLIVVGNDAPMIVRGARVHSIPRPEIYLLRQFIFHARVLAYVMRQLDSLDVILFHSISAPWMLPLFLLRRFQKRSRPVLVMDTRTLEMAHEGNESWKDRIRRAYHNFVENRINQWVDGRLAITHRMADAVNIPHEKLWGVWPSGVNQQLFAPALTARKWPMWGEPIQLVYVGVLNYERNLLTFCRAVERANSQGMNFKFSMIGDGTQRTDLENFAAQTEGRICVMPPVNHTQVPEILGNAHIGVLPFPDEEKFRVSSPIKLFEYMAAGLPILATRISCHTDVIENGDYAFWAENSDEESLTHALSLAWQRSECLSEMGQRSFSASINWTWRESANKLKSALELGIKNLANG